jgi:hypothetical protein
VGLVAVGRLGAEVGHLQIDHPVTKISLEITEGRTMLLEQVEELNEVKIHHQKNPPPPSRQSR